MDIPLSLVAVGDRKLVYTVPAWFRAVLALCAALVLASILLAGSGGILAWIILVASTLGALYEERWTLDREKAEIAHRYGLVPAARSLVLPLDRVSGFRLAAWVAGTIPGSADEAGENAAALAGGSPDDPRRRKREPHKRSWVQLRLVETDGTEYLLDTVPSRRAAALREIGRRLAGFADKPLIEG